MSDQLRRRPIISMQGSRHRDDWKNQSWKTEVKSSFNTSQPEVPSKLPQTPQECSIVLVRQSLLLARNQLKLGIQEAGRLCGEPDSLKCIYEGFSLLFQKRARELKLSGKEKIGSALEGFKRHVGVFLPVMLEDFFSRFVLYLNESEEHSSSAGANGSHSINNTSDREGPFGNGQNQSPINWNQALPGRGTAEFGSKPATLFDGDLGFEDENKKGSVSQGASSSGPGFDPGLGRNQLKGDVVRAGGRKRLISSKKTSEDSNKGPVLRMTSFRNFQTNDPMMKTSSGKRDKPHLNENLAKKENSKKRGLLMNSRLNSSAAIQKPHSSTERVGVGQRISRSQTRDEGLGWIERKRSQKGGLDRNLNWGGFGFNTEDAVRTGNLYLTKEPKRQSKELRKRGVSEHVSGGEFEVPNAGKVGSQPSDGSQTQTVNSTGNDRNMGGARVMTQPVGDQNDTIQALEADGLTMTNASNPSASTDQMRLFNMSSILPKNQQSDFEQVIESQKDIGIYIPPEMTHNKTESESIRLGRDQNKMKREIQKYQTYDQNDPRNILYRNKRRVSGGHWSPKDKGIDFNILEANDGVKDSHWGKGLFLPDTHIKPFVETPDKSEKDFQKESHLEGRILSKDHQNKNVEKFQFKRGKYDVELENSKVKKSEEENRNMKAVDYFWPKREKDKAPEIRLPLEPQVLKVGKTDQNKIEHLGDNKNNPGTQESFERSLYRNTRGKNVKKSGLFDDPNPTVDSVHGDLEKPRAESNTINPIKMRTEESRESHCLNERKKRILENRDNLKGAINNYFTKKFRVKKKKKRKRKRKNNMMKNEYGGDFSQRAEPKNFTQDGFVSAYESRDPHLSQLGTFSKMNMTVGGDTFENQTPISDRDSSQNQQRRETAHQFHNISNLSNLSTHNPRLSHMTNNSLGVKIQRNSNDQQGVNHPSLLLSNTPRTHKNLRPYMMSQNLHSPADGGKNKWHKKEGKKNYNPNSSDCTRVRSPLSHTPEGFCFKIAKTPRGMGFLNQKKVKIVPTHKQEAKHLKRNNLVSCLGKSNSTMKNNKQGMTGKISRNQSQAAKSNNSSTQSIRNKSMKRFGRGLRLNLSYKDKKKKKQSGRLPNSGKGIAYGKSANNSHKKRGSEHVTNSRFLKLSNKSSNYRLGKDRSLKKSHFKPKIKHKSTLTSNFKMESSRNSEKLKKKKFTKKVVPKLRERFKGQIGQIKLQRSGRKSGGDGAKAIKTVGLTDSGRERESCPMKFQDFQGLMGDLSKQNNLKEQKLLGQPKAHDHENNTQGRAIQYNLTQGQIENPDSERETPLEFITNPNPLDNGRTKNTNTRKNTNQSALHKNEHNISDVIQPQNPGQQERKSSVGRNNRRFWRDMQRDAEQSRIEDENLDDNIICNLDSQKFEMTKSELYSRQETDENRSWPNPDTQIIIPNFKIKRTSRQSEVDSGGRDCQNQIKKQNLEKLKLSSTVMSKEFQKSVLIHPLKTPCPKENTNRHAPSDSPFLNKSQKLQFFPRINSKSPAISNKTQEEKFSSSGESLKIKKKVIDSHIFASNDPSLPTTPRGGLMNTEFEDSLLKRKKKTRTPRGKSNLSNFGEPRKRGKDLFKKWKRDLRGRESKKEAKGLEKGGGRGRSAVGPSGKGGKPKGLRTLGYKAKRG